MKELGPKTNFLFIDRVQNIDVVTDSINKIVVQLSNTFN
ncbi:MAG: hypothetical protein K0S93_444 [Nitrososphaeraceae archaeon]|jgi:hypothetical protein|nr:hypothetical protein [Nitrososphaeraceae archaeon]